MAMESILIQTVPPDEIVLVKDGPLTLQLDSIIDKYSASSKIPCKIISLKKNIGLGEALSAGIKYCSYEWVARMDADDIALPDRFDKQFTYLDKYPNIDILGGWICEFDKSSEHCEKERRVPLAHKEIAKFAKYRNPMNHMTVVFKKEAIESVGGYLPMNGFEDYYLWMRMFLKGKVFANLNEVVVKARAGNEMIRRRQGWRYAKDEWALEKAAYQIGFWSTLDIGRNIFIRILPRLLPVIMVEKLYNILRNN